MIIIKRISLLVLTLAITSCSSQNRMYNVKHFDECRKSNNEAETQYDGSNKIIAENFNDFNTSKDKQIDIIRVISSSGYEYSEDFKRVYVENDKVLISDSNGTKEASNIDYKSFKSYFEKTNNNFSLVNCNRLSSKKYVYRYFVKVNNKLIMTFYANNILENIEKSLINEELKYLIFFEDIK